MNLNRVSHIALGYRNGKGIYNFKIPKLNKDITNLDGNLVNNFLYDYLSMNTSLP